MGQTPTNAHRVVYGHGGSVTGYTYLITLMAILRRRYILAKKKAVDEIAEQDQPDMPARSREVVYTIIVPNCTDTVLIERARRELRQHGIREALIHINAEAGTVSVPRLCTLWQGDAAERAWQQAIQNAIPGALIDVADWTPAPGYPMGEIGTTEGAAK